MIEMKINWILRLKNRVTATTLAVSVIGLIYLVLSMFGITPSVSESQVTTAVIAFIDILAMIGIVVDPTTEGFEDGELGLSYSSPKPKE
jgi:phi LC3 family holin